MKSSTVISRDSSQGRFGRGAPAHPRGLLVISLASLILLGAAVTAAAQTVSYTDFSSGPSQPVLTAGGPGAWDQYVREKVAVIQEGSLFKMWYVGHSSAGQSASKVGYATSTDGINWTKYPGNPVLDRPYQDQDIAVLRMPDGTYWMYIEVNNSWLDLFTSPDGLAWTAYAGNPVKTNAASPVVWREGSSWFMLYEYMVGPPFYIHLATSTDGRNWVDSPANPVLMHGSFTVPDSIVKEGSNYHLYYHQADDGAWYARSTDLVNWVDQLKLADTLTSQFTFRTDSGEVWAYFWSSANTSQYYLRYGRSGSGSDPTLHSRCTGLSTMGRAPLRGMSRAAASTGPWSTARHGQPASPAAH
jgi:beta-1,2-mannobiose phosphorylase / 1,2-beta-oligomannan phosphorylase